MKILDIHNPASFGAATVVSLLLAAAPLRAAEYTVTNGNDSGAGSLREVIDTANSTAGADTILFDAAVSEVRLASPITIHAETTIQGPGASGLTIVGDFDGTDMILASPFQFGLPARLEGLTVTTAPGRELRLVRGVSADLEFDDVILLGNNVELADSSGSAVVVQNGNLTMRDCVVQDHVTEHRGAGVFVLNAGQYTVHIERCAFLDNLVTSGDTSSFPASGGGLFVEDDSAQAPGTRLEILDSEFSGNEALHGGAIGLRNTVNLTLQNSTVSGNVARNYGGGIFGNKDTGSSYVPVVYLESSTITDNQAWEGGGIVMVAHLFMANTILAGNVATDSGLSVTPRNEGIVSGDDVVASYSLIGDGPGDAGGMTIAEHQSAIGSVMTETDPMLGPLADNGGPTYTHALLAGSPLIDAGSNGAAPRDTLLDVPTTDQRGMARDVGAAMDIGAYEYEPPPSSGGGGASGNGGGSGGGGGSTGFVFLALLGGLGLLRRRATARPL